MAHDHCGAYHVDLGLVWTVDNAMIISTVFGFILTIVGISETAVAGYKVIMTANNIHEKKEQNQLKASLHEEVQQILKDAIRKAGE